MYLSQECIECGILADEVNDYCLGCCIYQNAIEENDYDYYEEDNIYEYYR